MKNDIVEKLNGHITKGINSEADLVYMMVEIRKLLEHDENQAKNTRFWSFTQIGWSTRDWIDRIGAGRKY